MPGRLFIHSARQIVQVVDNGARILKGAAMKHLAILGPKDVLSPTVGYSIVVDNDGKIAAIGTDEEIRTMYVREEFTEVIDATGKCLIPGFVDGHTHAITAGDRVKEFAMKLAGASYMEVHAAGGGIHFTVENIKRSTKQELLSQFKQYLQRMMESGTTFVEVKSGYGLDTENELKMLEVIELARQDPSVAIDISSTYCGAHAVPRGKTAEEATDDILKHQIPALASKISSGELNVDNIDVFCEKGVFDVTQSRRILEAGKSLGMNINFHGEEICRLNSAEMGAEIGATAISHLEEVSDEGIAQMAAAGTVATLLPTTAYILRLTPPPARKMLDSGIAVALGSDFNPNAHCLAMPLVMHLACVLMHMSMPEALVAATLNAAASLGQSDKYGSIEVGKCADMLILDAPCWEHIIYQLGGYQYVIKNVIKSGRIVHRN